MTYSTFQGKLPVVNFLEFENNIEKLKLTETFRNFMKFMFTSISTKHVGVV